MKARSQSALCVKLKSFQAHDTLSTFFLEISVELDDIGIELRWHELINCLTSHRNHLLDYCWNLLANVIAVTLNLSISAIRVGIHSICILLSSASIRTDSLSIFIHCSRSRRTWWTCSKRTSTRKRRILHWEYSDILLTCWLLLFLQLLQILQLPSLTLTENATFIMMITLIIVLAIILWLIQLFVSLPQVLPQWSSPNLAFRLAEAIWNRHNAQYKRAA